jgi:hypothetical protein
VAIVENGYHVDCVASNLVPSESMLAALLRLTLVGLVVVASAGCQGTGGAVSVRWRIRDLVSGRIWDPDETANRDAETPGVCCPISEGGLCTAANAWIVDRVRIVLSDPKTGAENLDPKLGKYVYPCAVREATTDWELPLGRWALTLQATAHDFAGTPVLAATPAPEVRELTAGGVVNLQVIEVSVDPLPLPRPGSMATQ